MSDCSIVKTAMQLGARVIDLDTGELIGSPDFAGDTRGGSRVSGGVLEGSPASGGLSNPHICTRSEGSATFYLGGSLISCKKPALPSEQEGGGKRGKVKDFSLASRRRMIYMVAKIQRVKLPLMVTLTYPSEFPMDGVVWKNHLRRWWQRLKRRLPGAGMIWKLEPQQRGAPHFHLLIWGVDTVPLHEFREWVSRSWFQVVASGDERHLRAGTRVEVVRSGKGVIAYATKYLGKIVMEADVSGWAEPGRFWGVKGAECIPWAAMVQAALTYHQSVLLLRIMRKSMQASRRLRGKHPLHLGNLPSLTLLVNDADYWADRLARLIA